jgi:hypothetical protein
MQPISRGEKDSITRAKTEVLKSLCYSLHQNFCFFQAVTPRRVFGIEILRGFSRFWVSGRKDEGWDVRDCDVDFIR